MKHEKIAVEAARMYTEGYSLENIAKEFRVAYRTARKAVFSQGVELRDPSTRLVGRTRPDKKKASS
jgi:transposase